MKRQMMIAAVSSAALGWGAIAAAVEDRVVVNTDQAPSSLVGAPSESARPFKNPLPIPDTASVVPDTWPTPSTPGVMTQNGIVDLSSGTAPQAYGMFSIPYTTTPVRLGNRGTVASSYASYLSTTHPYRTVGLLTFVVGGSSSYCTATVIRRGVILTAAHCIQDFGTGPALFANWKFTPGYFNAPGATAAQRVPYGTWTWSALAVAATWSNGTDTGGGGARNNDLAVIVLKKSTAGKFIGDYVGWMGYGWNNYSFVSSPKTGNVNTGAVTTLGYPGLMDAGKIMQRTDGPTYTTTVSGALQLWQGSNFTSGSSGGPWVVNFKSGNAALSGGAVAGTASNIAVIGVTSWGTMDPNAPKDNYASQFAQNKEYPNAAYGIYGGGNIGALLNALCTKAAPGGGTYASQGYCN